MIHLTGEKLVFSCHSGDDDDESKNKNNNNNNEIEENENDIKNIKNRDRDVIIITNNRELFDNNNNNDDSNNSNNEETTTIKSEIFASAIVSNGSKRSQTPLQRMKMVDMIEQRQKRKLLLLISVIDIKSI